MKFINREELDISLLSVNSKFFIWKFDIKFRIFNMLFRVIFETVLNKELNPDFCSNFGARLRTTDVQTQANRVAFDANLHDLNVDDVRVMRKCVYDATEGLRLSAEA